MSKRCAATLREAAHVRDRTADSLTSRAAGNALPASARAEFFKSQFALIAESAQHTSRTPPNAVASRRSARSENAHRTGFARRTRPSHPDEARPRTAGEPPRSRPVSQISASEHPPPARQPRGRTAARDSGTAGRHTQTRRASSRSSRRTSKPPAPRPQRTSR